jgi:DNA sulfur modification protein DndD
MRLQAGTNDVESKYTGVSALLRIHDDIANNFGADYKEESRELRNCQTRAENLRTNINEISAQLTGVDNKLVAELEMRRQEQEAKRDQAIGDKFTANSNFEAAVSDLEEKQGLLKRLDIHKSEQNVAQNRLEKAEEIARVLDLLQESLANQVRLDLSEKVDETFQAIIRKPRRAIIDEDYSLQVLKTSNDGEEYISPEQSTGESQVASLSFISSIIALAKERLSKDGTFFQGGLYPLVMDSPFGTLDDDYREKIASKVSQLAEQVIIFVSNSQWQGKVAEACQGKLGVSYKLIYHKPNLPKAKENEYETRSETEFEYCTVEEVPV